MKKMCFVVLKRLNLQPSNAATDRVEQRTYFSNVLLCWQPCVMCILIHVVRIIRSVEFLYMFTFPSRQCYECIKCPLIIELNLWLHLRTHTRAGFLQVGWFKRGPSLKVPECLYEGNCTTFKFTQNVFYLFKSNVNLGGFQNTWCFSWRHRSSFSVGTGDFFVYFGPM